MKDKTATTAMSILIAGAFFAMLIHWFITG